VNRGNYGMFTSCTTSLGAHVFLLFWSRQINAECQSHASVLPPRFACRV
jgi:hypothetical protein